ncbi:MAG: VapC toxin family PIN domain ribonuclease [Chloroflexi bacterium]|nr:MAG: VapC toxin family PIN domain ribonuclease [Chloroflexota bacterium]
MSAYFVDTSALVKRYVNESGSTWVRSWIERPAGNTIIASELVAVEVYSALARRRRDGTLDSNAASLLQNDLLGHIQNEYVIITLESKILVQARQLIDRYPLRTLDAIQLATALYATSLFHIPLNFICADVNLLAAAAAEGFAVNNPNHHP